MGHKEMGYECVAKIHVARGMDKLGALLSQRPVNCLSI
jgi:hypothetical protein